MTREQYKYLRKIRRRKANIPADAINSLCELGYATMDIACCDEDGYPKYANTATITKCGIEALETERRNTFRFWFPNIISVAALILSVIALVSK